MNVGLRILLAHGHYVQVPMLPGEAAKTINLWSQGHYRLKDVQFLDGVSPDGRVHWCVHLPSVVAMHTFEIQNAPAYDPNQQINGSGFGWKNQ